MDVILDGVTPVSRSVVIREFLLHSDFYVELDRPAFLTAGDRVTYENQCIVVTRPNGERRTHSDSNSYWLCGPQTAAFLVLRGH
ncbi:hypothetical protein [Kitasatospora sp. NPDC057015]|uniref:hypothetical protein n=1 Tax=Kitasatospora sp. NPDC057015 TaxID=3346001 RepID=UPI00362BF84A